jgi:hypothetical protein
MLPFSFPFLAGLVGAWNGKEEVESKGSPGSETGCNSVLDSSWKALTLLTGL